MKGLVWNGVNTLRFEKYGKSFLGICGIFGLNAMTIGISKFLGSIHTMDFF